MILHEVDSDTKGHAVEPSYSYRDVFCDYYLEIKKYDSLKEEITLLKDKANALEDLLK